MKKIPLREDRSQKNLTPSPDNGRALYYSAVVERRMGDPDVAIADLKTVLDKRLHNHLEYKRQERFIDVP